NGSAAAVQRRALGRLSLRAFARARTPVVHDDPRPRPVLCCEHRVPPLGKLRIGPPEELLRVPRREIHAAMALYVAELRVPERAVKRVAPVEVLDVRDVLDRVGPVGREL